MSSELDLDTIFVEKDLGMVRLQPHHRVLLDASLAQLKNDATEELYATILDAELLSGASEIGYEIYSQTEQLGILDKSAHPRKIQDLNESIHINTDRFHTLLANVGIDTTADIEQFAYDLGNRVRIIREIAVWTGRATRYQYIGA